MYGQKSLRVYCARFVDIIELKAWISKYTLYIFMCIFRDYLIPVPYL